MRVGVALAIAAGGAGVLTGVLCYVLDPAEPSYAPG
jgi:hypothetical protein